MAKGMHQEKIDALKRIARERAGTPEGDNATRFLEKLTGRPSAEGRVVRIKNLTRTVSNEFGTVTKTMGSVQAEFVNFNQLWDELMGKDFSDFEKRVDEATEFFRNQVKK